MRRINAEDIGRAADKLGCDQAAVRAVLAVESRGRGFNPDGSVVTLFEGHKFHRFTDGRFDLSHPDLSYPTWSRQWYGDWEHEQDRLARATALDREAALKSASWGLFQIMGFNHGACGFLTVEGFVQAMRESEGRQLDAFVDLIEEWGLADEMRDRRWRDFARKYNGPAYAVNKYDVKLAAAWRKAAVA
jgi:hypothetical protein